MSKPLPLPIVDSPLQRGPAAVPTALTCLRCQLIGRRRLLCSEADTCRKLPIWFPVGPVLLGLWAATAIGFLVAFW